MWFTPTCILCFLNWEESKDVEWKDFGSHSLISCSLRAPLNLNPYEESFEGYIVNFVRRFIHEVFKATMGWVLTKVVRYDRYSTNTIHIWCINVYSTSQIKNTSNTFFNMLNTYKIHKIRIWRILLIVH